MIISLKKILRFPSIISVFLLLVLKFSSANVSNSQNQSQSTTENKSQKEKELTYIRETFKWGTYAQQAKMITKYEKYTPDEYPRHFKLLETYKQSLQSDITATALFNVIKKHKLDGYNDTITNYIKKTLKKNRIISRNTEQAVTAALEAIQALSNTFFTATVTNLYLDETLNKKNEKILGQSAAFIGLIHAPKMREVLKKDFNKASSYSFKSILIKSIAAYKETTDIPFFEKIIFDPAENHVLKWTALVELKNYAPSPKALSIINECYNSENLELKSRALYVLKFFKNDGIKEKIFNAAKDPSALLRYQAVKALENTEDPEGIELLQYKYKHDPEQRIRREAENILKEMGIIKPQTNSSN